WITSIATHRLKEQRKDNAFGSYIGGYGFVENLKPKVNNQSEGYIHAPSLSHAATAALLYNGYLSHSNSNIGHPLAIDLSSFRVKLGLELLDGIRKGQPLGALLGYRFERGLHEKELNEYMLPIRMTFPLGVN